MICLIAPFNEGHVLILPKKHYLDVEEKVFSDQTWITQPGRRLFRWPSERIV